MCVYDILNARLSASRRQFIAFTFSDQLTLLSRELLRFFFCGDGSDCFCIVRAYGDRILRFLVIVYWLLLFTRFRLRSLAPRVGPGCDPALQPGPAPQAGLVFLSSTNSSSYREMHCVINPSWPTCCHVRHCCMPGIVLVWLLVSPHVCTLVFRYYVCLFSFCLLYLQSK